MLAFEQIKTAFMEQTKVSGTKTNNPVIIATIGVTGVGNSTIARMLKRLTGWCVIEKNKIRVALREKWHGFNPGNTDEIHYAILAKILENGGNAILDSDFVEKQKRKKLGHFAKKYNARVFYIRLICNRDVMIERILKSRYNPKTDIFKNSVVAVREHLRRYPWHYRWSKADGGSYTLKKFGVKFLAEIDTTKSAVWKKKLKIATEKLKKF